MAKAARKKDITVIATREDADNLLKEIAEAKGYIETREARAEQKINEIREMLIADTAISRQTIAENEAALEEWAQRDRATWDGKTLVLNFGKIFFHMGTGKIVIKSAAKVLDRIKIKGWLNMIRQVEEPNKEAMESLTDEELKEIGVKRDKKEKFHYEVKREEVK